MGLAPHKSVSSNPSTKLIPIAPDDTTALPNPIRGINAAVAGTVMITQSDGTDVQLFCAAGIMLPVGLATHVKFSGTSASGLTGYE